ncbi:mechanosensitive ion channel family protein [Azohydromonas sediminis]|uniref:mechanosensitive ion channel family protein n=1 Tax=Azohydromonas sediminis TaxID=2259674 RepID=UPI000E64D99E|nr:mechanosensitive ion channel domain-containing protein [Azohydromonas sediminis]
MNVGELSLRPGPELEAFVAKLFSASALAELALLAACLGGAWLAVRLIRGAAARPGSIWFGDRIVDGVLFPVLALGAALLVRWLIRDAVPVTVFRLAVPILSSLVIIRVGVRVLHVAFPTSALVRALERTLSWVVWVGLVLWLTGLLPLIVAELDQIRWTMGGTQVSVRALVEGALTAIVVLVVALWVSAAIESRLLAVEGRAADELSLRKIAANATRALLLLVGLLIALSAAGIPLGALGVLGGAIGVGIGFGLQKLAANYVSGFVILAERSLRIGDLVRVDNFEGQITDITTRYTVIRSLGGRESIVPNEMLITSRIENLSLADRNVLLNTVLQVPYGTDVEPVMARLTDVVRAVPRVLADPAPSVRLTNFAADGLELTLFFWIGDPENGQANVRSEVNLAILRTLGEMGIEIPFPQRVLHLRAGTQLTRPAP